MPDVASVLGAIDGALEDWTVSGDAMRCTGRAFPRLGSRDIETVRQVMHDTGLDGYAAWFAVADVTAQSWHGSPYADWVEGVRVHAMSDLVSRVVADRVAYGSLTLNRARELQGLSPVSFALDDSSYTYTAYWDTDPSAVGSFMAAMLGVSDNIYVVPQGGWYEVTWSNWPTRDDDSYLWRYSPGDDEHALTFTWKPDELAAWPDPEWVTRARNERRPWTPTLPEVAAAGPFTAREVAALGAGEVVPLPPPDFGTLTIPLRHEVRPGELLIVTSTVPLLGVTDARANPYEPWKDPA